MNGCKPIIFALIGLLGAGHVQAQQQGRIEKTQGDVKIVRGNQTIVAKPGQDVRASDRIVVGAGGAAGITTPDNGRLAIGPNSQAVVDQINFNKESGDGNLAVRILKGTFSMITGAIGKMAPQKTQVKTPTATIGIRGTEFCIRVDLPAEAEKSVLSGAPDAPAPKGIGVVVGLDQGAVEVKSTTGKLGHYREHRQAEQADFDAFKKEINDGVQKEKDAFEKYKDQVQREFVGYVESVTLKPGSEISLSGDTAIEREGVGENAARDFMRHWKK